MYIMFVHHTTSIFAKLRIWCFEHSGDISCSLLVNPNHTDESWEGRDTCLWIYVYIYIYLYIYIYCHICVAILLFSILTSATMQGQNCLPPYCFQEIKRNFAEDIFFKQFLILWKDIFVEQFFLISKRHMFQWMRIIFSPKICSSMIISMVQESVILKYQSQKDQLDITC